MRRNASLYLDTKKKDTWFTFIHDLHVLSSVFFLNRQNHKQTDIQTVPKTFSPSEAIRPTALKQAQSWVLAPICVWVSCHSFPFTYSQTCAWIRKYDLWSQRISEPNTILDPWSDWIQQQITTVDLWSQIKFVNGSWIPRNSMINNITGSMILTDLGTNMLWLI